MRDVTKLSREDLLRILGSSYDEIFVTNAAGVVVYVSASCISHYGCVAEKMVGKHSKEMTEQNLWGPRLSPIAMRYKRRLTMKQLSCTGITMLTTASPVFNSRGEVDYIIENVRDFSESTGIERELEESKAFLDHIDANLEAEDDEGFTIENFVANSRVMRDLIKMSRRIATVNSNVLITGDSGVGKSKIARYIHDKSPRQQGRFLEINCAALPEALIESELFGYKKGAFSGAVSQGKQGLIQAAESGTLFLDEIGELPIGVQAKLLRFIQDGNYFEVGGTQEKHADCRIIAATNRDLPEMVATRKFRQDLYYRLKVFEITIPPLSQRSEDIIPLISFFLQKNDEKYHVNQQLSSGCIEVLSHYSWPGNVRELSNVIEQIVVMSSPGIITEKDLPTFIRRGKSLSEMASSGDQEESFRFSNLAVSYQERYTDLTRRYESAQKKLLKNMYQNLKSSRKISKELGISESSAYRLLKKYCPELLEK